MAEIPEDLIDGILLRLPVATLMRFRCVSKKWRNLIDSPSFVKSHLDHPNKAHSMMIFAGKPNAYCVDFDSICNASAPLPTLKELTNPSLGNSKVFGVLGPCNGLFCIHTSFNSSYCFWNPSTRKYFHVPQLPVRKPDDGLCSWGLGYDCNSDDYKVACIVRLRMQNDGSAAFIIWIYSLNSGFWKSTVKLPHILYGYGEKGEFVNGALHWIVFLHSQPRGSKMIAAFDLGNLECSLIPLPVSEYRSEGTDVQMRIGVLDGCLYAIYHDLDTSVFDLWIMKEYGVKESWTRLIAHTSYSAILTPLAYTQAGNELLFVDGSEFPYDDKFSSIVRYVFETKSFKVIFNPSLPDLRCPLVYIPSLVCPDQSVGNSYVALQSNLQHKLLHSLRRVITTSYGVLCYLVSRR